MRIRTIVIVALLLVASRAGAQCGGASFYRWKEKIAVPPASGPVDTVHVGDMLKWDFLTITKKKDEMCADRSGRELTAVILVGYLRRVKIEGGEKGDGDIHMELTADAGPFTGDCIIAEIPEAKWGDGFDRTRSAVAAIIGRDPTASAYDLALPIQVKLAGAPFWDGEHMGKEKPVQHGRCNNPGMGVWEIHPVVRIGRVTSSP